ncbi:eukaryotic translation initiation factor eIF-1 [Aspergillus arachidicola]|nr:eukaryotic translation initiation factor eIF-1 [Aspergillus arachidicola]
MDCRFSLGANDHLAGEFVFLPSIVTTSCTLAPVISCVKMASKKDMRRLDLAIPYVDPPANKDDADMSGAMTSTMPMAAMFTRNRMIGWVSFVFSLQNWLGETPEQKRTASTPAYMSVFMSLMALVVVRLKFSPYPPCLVIGSGTYSHGTDVFPYIHASAGGSSRCYHCYPFSMNNANLDHLDDQLDEDMQMSDQGLSHSFTAFPHRGAKSGRAPQKALSSSSLVFSPTTPSHSPSALLRTLAIATNYRVLTLTPRFLTTTAFKGPFREKAEFMSIENLKTFDPFAEADEDTGETKQSQNYIHIRIQQRNGRKTLTTVQGLPKKFDQKKILKVIKKKFACNGTIVADSEMGEVIQLQGDQRKDVQEFLTDKKEGLELDAKTIKVHGF